MRGAVIRSGSASFANDERSGVHIQSGAAKTFVLGSEIERGWSWRSFRGQEILSLRLRSGDEWRIQVDDVEEAMRFLDTLGLDASKRKVRVLRRKTGTFAASVFLSLVPLVGYFVFFLPSGNALDSAKSEEQEARGRLRVRVAELAEEIADPDLSRAFSELAEDTLSDEAVTRVARRAD